MGSEFTFYDYIDADGSGDNVISSWLNNEGKPAKARFTMMIASLEASPPSGMQDSVWKEPYTETLKYEWDGFIAIRGKKGRVQYRLLGQMLGRKVFLVTCGIHKSKKYITDVSSKIALKRIEQMANDPARYRREHEYN